MWTGSCHLAEQWTQNNRNLVQEPERGADWKRRYWIQISHLIAFDKLSSSKAKSFAAFPTRKFLVSRTIKDAGYTCSFHWVGRRPQSLLFHGFTVFGDKCWPDGNASNKFWRTKKLSIRNYIFATTIHIWYNGTIFVVLERSTHHSKPSVFEVRFCSQWQIPKASFKYKSSVVVFGDSAEIWHIAALIVRTYKNAKEHSLSWRDIVASDGSTYMFFILIHADFTFGREISTAILQEVWSSPGSKYKNVKRKTKQQVVIITMKPKTCNVNPTRHGMPTITSTMRCCLFTCWEYIGWTWCWRQLFSIYVCCFFFTFWCVPSHPLIHLCRPHSLYWCCIFSSHLVCSEM